MVYQELITEVENLPLAEQLSLMETLARFISRRTVESHRDHIKVKLELANVQQLHQLAFQWVQDTLAP